MLLLVGAPVDAEAQRLVLLVRHAERADGGVPSPKMQGPADPDLSAEGRARADRLAALLGEARITRIFVTEFRRTAQTAEPLAKRLSLSSERIPSADVKSLTVRLAAAPDDIVLIVGHSNTLPQIVTALGGPPLKIAESDYGNLFLLVPATRT